MSGRMTGEDDAASSPIFPMVMIETGVTSE